MTFRETMQFRRNTARGWPRWRQARTFDDLGELVADWLLGVDAVLPWHSRGPDVETAQITSTLVALNRGCGIFTTNSQPAMLSATDRQRASVTGVAHGAATAVLRTLCAADPSLHLSAAPVLALSRTSLGADLPVTQVLARGRWQTVTWGSVAMLEDLFLPAETVALFPAGTHTFSVSDLEWGRRDHLWGALLGGLQPTRAGGAS